MASDPLGTPSSTTTAGHVINSIRAQIPDPVSDPAVDGTAFTFQTLLRWVNDAMRIMATSAPIVFDWYAVRSRADRDVYELPSYILSVEQLWYDLWPCWRAPEADSIFRSRTTGNSYFFGPNTLGDRPKLHVWPQTSRTGASTALTADLAIPTFSDNPTDIATLNDDTGATRATVTADSTSDFMAYGFVQIEDELIRYSAITSAVDRLQNLVRGIGGTAAVAHNNGATVNECNIIMKTSRLPRPLTGTGDRVEIPAGLVPLIELYVLAKVREAEQEHQVASAMIQDFRQATDKLQASAQLKGLRQGIQVRLSPTGPWLYGGRTYIP